MCTTHRMCTRTWCMTRSPHFENECLNCVALRMHNVHNHTQTAYPVVVMASKIAKPGVLETIKNPEMHEMIAAIVGTFEQEDSIIRIRTWRGDTYIGCTFKNTFRGSRYAMLVPYQRFVCHPRLVNSTCTCHVPWGCSLAAEMCT